jgi:hypothetical protein
MLAECWDVFSLNSSGQTQNDGVKVFDFEGQIIKLHIARQFFQISMSPV